MVATVYNLNIKTNLVAIMYNLVATIYMNVMYNKPDGHNRET